MSESFKDQLKKKAGFLETDFESMTEEDAKLLNTTLLIIENYLKEQHATFLKRKSIFCVVEEEDDRENPD